MSDPDAIRAFEHAGWQQAANTYVASFATATRPFIPALLDAAGIVSGMTVLDIACGPGFVTAAAAGRGSTARGLDFSPAMLDVARAVHPGVRFDPGDAEALPYPDAMFDAVVSNFGIHHVPRPIMALREARRVLRPGGTLAFTIWAAPDENMAWKLVFDAIGRHGSLKASGAPVPGGGFRTPADCRAALDAAGFSAPVCERAEAQWPHADGRALLTALRSGTARMAALISAQSHAALHAIAADIDQHAAPFRTAAGLSIPITAYIARGQCNPESAGHRDSPT